VDKNPEGAPPPVPLQGITTYPAVTFTPHTVSYVALIAARDVPNLHIHASSALDRVISMAVENIRVALVPRAISARGI
jgi:hypothetical protein